MDFFESELVNDWGQVLYRWGAKHELDQASKAFIAENGAAQATRLSKINRVRPIHLQISTRNEYDQTTHA